MLTLYYASATFLQSFRIQKVCNKIAEHLAQPSSISFYTLQPGSDDGFDPTYASSELCGNRNEAKVTDILWLMRNQRGCCLRPIQTLEITPWISFPAAPSWLPFDYAADTLTPVASPTAESTTPVRPRILLSQDKSKHIQLLLEAKVQQTISEEDPSATEALPVRLEDFGKLIAWKIDSHLAVLIETDLEHFTQLLITTFLKNNLCINDQLPLMRIESVQLKGQPQPFELLANHLKRQSRNSAKLTEDKWKKHLEDLRGLSVLAHQATEFEQQKNRTETKPKETKPDLLAHEDQNQTQTEENIESQDKCTDVVKAAKTVQSISPVGGQEKLVFKSLTPKSSESAVPLIEVSANAAAKSFLSFKPQSPPAAAPIATYSRSTLKRQKQSLRKSKPLNILVYSDSTTGRESTLNTLQQLLERNVYTIYPLLQQQAYQKHWLDQTALLVVCGSVTPAIGQIFVDYFLQGGKVLSLCSDILHIVLPNYRTAEVREHELVQFSYDKWQRVKMMHHIFCYQPSPVKKHFSTDSEESSKSSSNSRKPSTELKDLSGYEHRLDVQVLGFEETWNTPSLLLANSLQSGGTAVFSQVHLETNPIEFESDELKFEILKQSDRTRLEIFADILQKHLDVQVAKAVSELDIKSGNQLRNYRGEIYQRAFFLGRHESKFELLEKLRLRCSGADNVIATPKLALKFCGKDETAPMPNNTNVLPILIHSCPDDFSTVDYFDHLTTEHIGRLVIYAPIISSSMHVINNLELIHGLAVLPLRQTAGVGRSQNQWLSPLGCAMFSLQLHLSMDSSLGSRLPLIQHVIGAAVVNSLRSHKLYRVLDVALKWPNDVYANGDTKIGGLIVNTTLLGSQAIVNIGCGINLNNSNPTVCINDMIKEFNERSVEKLPLLKYEEFIALIFNEIERLLADVQNGDFESFYTLYYSLWLHSDQIVKICLITNEKEIEAQIIGIDAFGFLRVKLPNGKEETVQPDGNSFDMLKGLIVPKYK
ncbi:biotin--protein ligase isoform X2 [Drosophila tropicalis]|uniref:biotin--protein ligase isoform X2 n=1 Tax=Drosophila tropicalis TaxID=46794 RepID=UPI0035AB73DA